ncbi:leucine-rich repeat and fibronectin type III domain-containing protein 1-like protein [Pleurodeles waltl]|uniref:leucine-rich repeat and fibronectin type III domain-containing protein 1-like protein n=1 Tax=Pleurodeles waltl TaxID=8319 RepID=UPI00370997B4
MAYTVWTLLLLLSVLHFLHVESASCPPGCQCDTASISCCKSGEYLPDTIIGHPNITKMILNFCNTLDITSRTFANLDNLIELTIRHTNIAFIDASAFSGLKSLSHLRLNEVNLQNMDLHGAAFQDLQLQHLDLSNNSLTTINSQMFSGLSKLKTLNLSRNKISLIHDKAFENQVQLSILNLDYNSLSTITPMWFKASANYSSLQIHLMGNSLTQECEYRGVSITENQWFIQSLQPNISVNSGGVKAPECSKPSFVDLYKEVYVQEPFPVGLVCSANGYPTPRLTWLFPSGVPVTSPIRSIFVKNGMLILNPVQASMAGLYACIATNSEGSAASLYRLVVVPLPAPRTTTTTTTTATSPTAILLQPTLFTATQNKTTLILIWVCVGLLLLALAFFIFYVLKKIFKWGKKKMSTGFEFKKFPETPNILMVPENPKPMPHVYEPQTGISQ